MKAFTSLFRVAIVWIPSSACQISGRLEQTGSASPRNMQFGDLGRLICGVYQGLNLSARAVAANDTNELFDVMPAHLKLGHSLFRELGGAFVICRLGDVVQLMLHQGAELKVSAGGAEVGGQGDNEGRHFAEPIQHLLLHPGFLPTACTDLEFCDLVEHELYHI